MKKIFLAALMVVIAFSAKAQLSIGIETGLQLSGAKVDGIADQFTPDNSNILSFRPALNIGYDLDDKFSIYSGLATETRGFDAKLGTDLNFLDIDLPVGATAETRVKYLEIPLGLRFNIPTNSNIKPWIQGGVSLGYAMSGEITTSVNAIININVNETEINLDNDNVSRWDVAPAVAAGIDIPYGNGAFSLALAYEHSTKSFIDDKRINIEARHWGLTPSIGYKFYLNGGRS